MDAAKTFMSNVKEDIEHVFASLGIKLKEIDVSIAPQIDIDDMRMRAFVRISFETCNGREELRWFTVTRHKFERSPDRLRMTEREKLFVLMNYIGLYLEFPIDRWLNAHKFTREQHLDQVAYQALFIAADSLLSDAIDDVTAAVKSALSQICESLQSDEIVETIASHIHSWLEEE